jgi:hypothetical protein
MMSSKVKVMRFKNKVRTITEGVHILELHDVRVSYKKNAEGLDEFDELELILISPTGEYTPIVRYFCSNRFDKQAWAFRDFYNYLSGNNKLIEDIRVEDFKDLKGKKATFLIRFNRGKYMQFISSKAIGPA